MTARKTSPPGAEHYKVRVVLPGALLHLASETEPRLVQQSGGQLVDVVADWISDPELGDALGYIDWTAVVGITWRYTGTA